MPTKMEILVILTSFTIQILLRVEMRDLRVELTQKDTLSELLLMEIGEAMSGDIAFEPGITKNNFMRYSLHLIYCR